MNKILLLFSFCLFLSCAREQTKMAFDLREYIYIPVKINGKEYKFIFDTGVTRTTLSHELTKELGLSHKPGDSVKVNSAREKRLMTSYEYDEILFDIGDLSIKSAFISNDKAAENIIGVNLILQLHWLFNFQDSTVRISKDSISVSKEHLVSLKLEYTSNDNIIVPVLMNDSVTKNFIFDTGYQRLTNPADCCKPDLEIDISQDSESLIKNLTGGQNKNLYFELNNGAKGFIFPNLKINNQDLDYMFVGLEIHPHHEILTKESIHGMFTLPFITERFSMFQINPDNKTISLYSSGHEHAEKEKKLKHMHEVLVEQYYRQQEQAK